MFYDIEKVKEIDIKNVCELYGIDLRRKGQNLWGKIRNEKTDSFSINPIKNIWRDWGMAEGGDVISLVSKLESTSYGEAIKILGSRFDIPGDDKTKEYKSLPTPNQFKEININSTRVSLNLDINLENNTVEEVEKMYEDKKYSMTMYELSKEDNKLYHEIIDNKAIDLIERDKETFVNISKKYKKETGEVEKLLYKDMLEELEVSINNEIDIYNKSRMDGKELNSLKVKFKPEVKKLQVEDLINKIEKAVGEYTETPEQLKEYMKFMSKFYKYSVSNNMLMQNQFAGAKAVGSYKFWKEKGFSVNKGEKAIKILVPNKSGSKYLDEDGKWKSLSKAGEEEKEKMKNGDLIVSANKMYFSMGNVFDISQTNAKAEDLPKIFPNKWLEGDLKDYSVLYKGLENIAKSIDVKIIEPKAELGVSKGCSYIFSREVALNPRNSELQNIKTLIHELTHAKLHNEETYTKYTDAEKEFQAELTAFTVCSYFNIDTSEYSLSYISHWSKEEIRDKQELLKEVNTTVKEYIDILEETLIKERESVKMNETKFKEKYNVVPVNGETIDKIKEFVTIKDLELKDGTIMKKGAYALLSSYGEEDGKFGAEWADTDEEIESGDDWRKIVNNKRRWCTLTLEDIKSIAEPSEIGLENYKYYEERRLEKHLNEFYNEREFIWEEEEEPQYVKSDSEIEYDFERNTELEKELAIKYEYDKYHDEYCKVRAVNKEDTRELITEIRAEEIMKSINGDKHNIENEKDLEKEVPIPYNKAGDFFKEEKFEVNKDSKGSERNMLSEFENFKSLLDKKYYLKEEIDILKDDMKNYYPEANYPSKEELKCKLELCTDLYSFVEKEIHEIEIRDGIIEDEAEIINYIEKEYITKSDIKLEDGSFIMEGTSFFVDGFKDGDFEIHFEAKEGNVYIPNEAIGDGYYFNENEIMKYADLSKIKDLYSKVENINLKDDIQQKVNVKDKEAVSEMISALKEKEINKNIKDHKEWIDSNGVRGKQLNLENENLRGMKFLDVDLRNSNMKNTDLSDCIFFADLRGANLTGAKIENSKFTGSNLGKITIEANKLNLIEYQIEQEADKHKWANKNLSTNIKRQKLEKE